MRMREIILSGVLLISSLSGHANEIYPFQISNEKDGDGYRIVARNDGPAPVSVRLTLPLAVNTTPDRAYPFYAVVPPNGGIVHLGRVRATIPEVSYTFRSQSTWVLGDFNAAQHPEALYRLPFKDGQTYRIGQAPGGPITTHNSDESRYAIDIPLPQGTPIVAARDGVVIAAEAGQTYGAKHPDLLAKANEVRVLHMDGTMATYAHLAYGGVFVYAGQRVLAGQEIGLAGSTGYSSGSHLHFAVLKVERAGDGFSHVSLPFQFYVGNPPVAFNARYGMIAKADYSQSAGVTGFAEPRQRLQLAAVPAGNDAGSTEGRIYFEIPEPVKTFVRGTTAWQWLAGFGGLVVLLIVVDKIRGGRRRATMADKDWAEPVWSERGAGETLRPPASALDQLLFACNGDRTQALHLIERECASAPTISEGEATYRALDRLVRDRGR